MFRQNPDNPNAESLFNTLKQGADLLLDPAQRAEYDKKYAAEKARKERFAALDNKRKAGLANLEEREKEFKKQQMDRERTVNQAAQVEMLKGEAARKRQERQRLAEQEQQQRQQQQQDALKAQNRGSTASQSAAGVHDLGPLDTTLLLSFPKALFPDGDAVRSQLSACAPTSAIDNVVYSDKKPKKNNKSSAPLQAKAVVALNTLAATIAIYKAMSKPESAKQGVEVKWASKDPPALARKALGLDKQEQQRPFVDASLDKPQESHQQVCSCCLSWR